MRRSAITSEASPASEAHTAPSRRPAAPTGARPSLLYPADRELIDRITARDVSGLSLLYDRYGPLIYTLALRITESQEMAEALVGDVFALCWYVPSHLATDNVATTLIAITRQHARKGGSGASELTTSYVTADDSTQIQMWPHLAPDGVEPVDMWAALAALPDQQRECIELAYYDRLDLTAIAERLQLSRHAVMQSLQQGMRTLKAHIDIRKQPPPSSG